MSPHAAHPTAAMIVVMITTAAGFVLGGVDDDAVRRQQENRDFRRILKRGALDLGRRDDAGLDDVDEFAGQRVPAFAVLALHDPANDHAAARARVFGNLLQRGRQGLADDLHAGSFIAFFIEVLAGVEGLERADERDAAAGDNAFFNRGAGRVQRIFDAGLLLFEFGFGRGPDIDLGNAAGQLRGDALAASRGRISLVGDFEFPCGSD